MKWRELPRLRRVEDGDIDSVDPTYRTYYMVDWETVHQTPSKDRCVSCGKFMMNVEPIQSNAGRTYQGRVCHNCKTIFWLGAKD